MWWTAFFKDVIDLDKTFTGLWLVQAGLWGRWWLVWSQHLVSPQCRQFKVSGQSVWTGQEKGGDRNDPADRNALRLCVCAGSCVSAAWSLGQAVSSVLSAPYDRRQHYIRPLAETNDCGKSQAPATSKLSDVICVCDPGLIIWTKKKALNFRECWFQKRFCL